MISRYSRPEMVAIWSTENRFRIWFEIEALACEKLADLGKIPKDAAENIRKKASSIYFDIKRIEEIEKETRHDVIAFLTYLEEIIGSDARFIHQGMTSSDVLDTCFATQLSSASDILIADIDLLLGALKKQALKHKQTITIGRSHGIHAEPTTFGLKLAFAYAEFNRCRNRILAAREEIATCMISGATGTFANIDPQVQEHVAQSLGLKSEPVSTQIIARDRHAMFFSILAITASCIERLSIEIRHLQRTEVLEVEEYFSPGQKGSSAMPHKRNPILSENLTGLARMVRSFAFPAMENIALWHERDISHSAVERMIGPDATITLDFALARLTNIIENLIIHPKRMEANLHKLGGLIHSQSLLLALIQKGTARKDAYEWIQTNAMKVWDQRANFFEEIMKDQKIRSVLSENEITQAFDLKRHTKYVDEIFKTVFNKRTD